MACFVITPSWWLSNVVGTVTRGNENAVPFHIQDGLV